MSGIDYEDGLHRDLEKHNVAWVPSVSHERGRKDVDEEFTILFAHLMVTKPCFLTRKVEDVANDREGFRSWRQRAGGISTTKLQEKDDGQKYESGDDLQSHPSVFVEKDSHRGRGGIELLGRAEVISSQIGRAHV